jgi:hypothetical protein
MSGVCKSMCIIPSKLASSILVHLKTESRTPDSHQVMRTKYANADGHKVGGLNVVTPANGIMLVKKRCLDVGDTWCPNVSDSLYFLNELAARNLCRANLLLSIRCDRRVLIGAVERIAQKHNVSCLQCSECLSMFSNTPLTG